VAAVTVMLVVRTAAADDRFVAIESGNALLALCQSANPYDRQSCRWYSAGMSDTLSMLKKICPPVDVTGKQISDIIVNYLVARPEWRQYSAPDITQQALLAVWPCQ